MSGSELESNDPYIQQLLDRIAEVNELMRHVDPGSQVYQVYAAAKRSHGQRLIDRLNANLGKRMPVAEDRRMPGKYETVAEMIRRDRDAHNQMIQRLCHEWYKSLIDTTRRPSRGYHLQKLIDALTGMAGGAGGASAGGSGILGTLLFIGVFFGSATTPQGSAQAKPAPPDPRQPAYCAYLLLWLQRTWRRVVERGCLSLDDLPYSFDDWVKQGCGS